MLIPPADFWGEYENLIRITIDETAAEIAGLVAEKLAQAQSAFRRIYDALGEEQKEALTALVSREIDREELKDDTFVCECPACSSSALLCGENVVDYDVEYDHRERTIIGGSPFIEFQASTLKCPTCGLWLAGIDELLAAGIESVFVNDDADIDAYMRDYYSDQDPM